MNNGMVSHIHAPSRKRPARAAVGFTVKSGWATAVLLTRDGTSLHIVDSSVVVLADPDEPDARQPYHAGFGTARETGTELSRLVAAIKRFGGRSMARTLRRYAESGLKLCGGGVVVGSLIDPRDIANDHIRIHALEGRLFRTVVQDGLSRHHLACSTWRERDLVQLAAKRLSRSEPSLQRTLAAMGREAAGPWRAEQKRAALAAWIVLEGKKL
jgi:hypothetical protein